MVKKTIRIPFFITKIKCKSQKFIFIRDKHEVKVRNKKTTSNKQKVIRIEKYDTRCVVGHRKSKKKKKRKKFVSNDKFFFDL